MQINNVTITDIDQIYSFYRIASDYQKAKEKVIVWPDFNRNMVETEIAEHRQFKMLMNNEVVCIWAITFNDEQIWEERNRDSAIYIHRIATNPDFRGRNFVSKIVDWAKEYAKEKGIQFDIVVNIQGDEPFIDPNLIEELVHSFDDDQVSMVSAMSKIENIKDLQDPNVVKVVVDTQNNAIYFSRAPIPFPRDHQEIIRSNEELKKHNFFRHIGIYGYRKDFLAKYIEMDQTNLEKLEKLEQLRVIENGFKIKMIEAATSLTGIDTQEDYEEALKKY